MADFKKAFLISMGHEGSYSNDPTDRGGETYKGIARNKNYAWLGWSIIDGYKSLPDFKKKLEADAGLQALVDGLYKLNYWDSLKLDDVKNQDIANELFDTAINMGVGVAANFLQEAVNLLNRNQKSYADIKVDGKIGFQSINTLNAIANPEPVLKTLNGLQFERYKDICKNDPTQERFFNGWLNRV